MPHTTRAVVGVSRCKKVKIVKREVSWKEGAGEKS